MQCLSLFDPKAETTIREGTNLPHWHQSGVTYFVTFRTEDSIPADVAKQWWQHRADWLRRRGIDLSKPGWKTAFEQLAPKLQGEFHNTFSRQYLESLDRGAGACVLRKPECAQIVADSLMHFDGSRYLLGDFIVMPNHVHLLVCLLGDSEIEAICYSWKQFTATKLNRLIGRKGRFWQEESFDHLVRSAGQYDAICRYIAENGMAAKLASNEYLYRRRQEVGRYAPRAVRYAV